MTVGNQTVLPVSLALDGTTRVWTIDFRILKATDASALIVDGADETQLELGVDYSVAFEPDEDQFELTLTSAADTTGKRLVVNRSLDFVQEADFDDGTAFPAEANEQAHDRAVMLMQQLAEGLSRAVKLPVSSQVRDVPFPAPDEGKYLRATAGGVEWAPLVADDIQVPDSTSTIAFPGDIGLSTDSANNSPLLNAYMRQLSASGGGTILLQSEPGDAGKYHFEDSIFVPSFVSLSGQSPTTLGPKASIEISGGKRSFATGLKLVASVTAGGSTITVDTSSAGGGAVSSYLTVGKPLQLRDDFDASGNARKSESNVVSAIDDGTRVVTLVDALDNGYALATTRIIADDALRLAVNTTNLSNLITVEPADLARANLYDWVLLEDDRQENGVTDWMEIAQIVGVETDGSNVITLSRQVRRVYLTAQHARLTILEPAMRAQVVGFAPERVEAPAAGGFVPTFAMRYALDCAMVDCQEPNSGAFGTDGNAFRIHKSYNCWFVRPNGRNAKHTAEGEGNGVVCIYSTRCGAISPVMSGMRHAFQMSASTECAFLDVDGTDGLLADVDFHGLNSVGCGVSIRQISTGNRTASASNGGIVCGNPTHLDGDHDCWVAGGPGGVVGPYGGADDYALRMYPPSTNFTAIGINGRDIRVFLLHQDTAGSDLVADGLSLIDCTVDGCSDRLFDCRGGANGSAVKTLTNVSIQNFRAKGLTIGGRFDQVGNVEIDDARFVFSNPSAADRYGLFFDDVTKVELADVRIKGANRGVWLKDVAHYFTNVGFIDLVDTMVRNDQGAADGIWRMCWYRGFAASYGTSGGSTITDDPTGNIGTIGGDLSVGDNSLTLAKLVTTSQHHMLARTTAGTGNWEDVTVGAAALAALAAATTTAAFLAHLGGAPLAGPSLTGVPTAPTASLGTNSTQLATTAFVAAAVADLVGSAPGVLDTLDELATALGDDANFAATVTTALSGKQPLHAILTAIAGLTISANKGIYGSGANTLATFDQTALARTFMGLSTVNLQLAALNGSGVALSDGATIATDCSLGQMFTVTLGGNRTLGNPTNVAEGASYCWRIKQDGTGTRTLALGANFKLPAGQSWAASTAANAVDFIYGVGGASSVIYVTGIVKGFT